MSMPDTTEHLPIESTEAFKMCFKDTTDPAFQRYIGRIRILERNSRNSDPHLKMKKERKLLPNYEKLFIVPKEFLKYRVILGFDPKTSENVIVVDHRNLLLANLDLLAYFNRRNDVVQMAILHKIKRMVYWRTKNGTETEDRRKMDLLYRRIRNFHQLSPEDLGLFSRIMSNHYEKRHTDS